MALQSRFLVALSLLVCVACQGGSSDGMATSDGAVVVTDASADSLQLTCNADESVTFPPFTRGCVDASDCGIANHQTDCCGNAIATGIAATDLAAFEQSEAACKPFFPDCGCPALPPLLDDGTTSNTGNVGVQCSDEGICETFDANLPGGGN